jgi:acyl-CoA dehydrogenase
MYAGSTSIYYMGTPEQKEKLLRPIIAGEAVVAGAQCEPTGVAHYEDFQTKAEIVGDECVINGGKIFCTNAGQAKYYTVMAKTKEPVPEGMGSITTVLVPGDAPGFKVGHIENKLGWHGSSTGQIYFNNCRVPKENILGSFDVSFTDALSGAFGIAAMLGAGQLGSAEGVYEKTLGYSKEKKHGDTTLFDSYQAMRHQFVDLWMEIETYRGFIYGLLDSLDHDESLIAQAWAAKVKGTRMFEYVASQCVVLNGGNGTVVENDIERYYRDAKMNSIGCFALPHITDMLTALI